MDSSTAPRPRLAGVLLIPAGIVAPLFYRFV
jgi:hypothetical protein